MVNPWLSAGFDRPKNSAVPKSGASRPPKVRSTSSGRKLLRHPNKGALHFEYASFQANDDLALKLIIYTPVEPAQ